MKTEIEILDEKCLSDDECPFFKNYKIYNDGSHYIAREEISGVKGRHYTRKPQEKDEIFNELYRTAVESLLTGKEKTMEAKEGKLIPFILTGMEDYYGEEKGLDSYVTENVRRLERNYWQREKRFKRKAYLNPWNYFATFTYDGKKHTEESFRKKLRKCLSNLHTRRGWRFMGVFERGEENGRLHFHCLLFVPEGEMVGEIQKKKDYSKRTGKVQETFPNDFFERKFGRNDFKEINKVQLKNGDAIDYILKYMRKTGENIVYSRGIPTEITKRISERAFAAEMPYGYVTKYVIFDNVISYEKDIEPIINNRKRRKSAAA